MISLCFISQRDNKGETERQEVIINHNTPQWPRTVCKTPAINPNVRLRLLIGSQKRRHQPEQRIPSCSCEIHRQLWALAWPTRVFI